MQRWNHYLRVQGTNLYKVYNYHDSRAYGYNRSGVLSRLDGYEFWNSLCGSCVILCAPLWIILYDILIQLNCVVLACSFSLVNRMLIIDKSSIGIILLLALLQPYPCYYGMHIIIFPHLLSTNHKCTQPCPTATQKLKKIWSTSMKSSRRVITLG
jgi:hypothetical protein